jgi:CheY-specific phosphatase CheX
MVLGICLSFPKMGSSLNNYVTPKLSTFFEDEGHYMNVAGPIFVGGFIMSISMVLAIGNHQSMQSFRLSTEAMKRQHQAF